MSKNGEQSRFDCRTDVDCDAGRRLGCCTFCCRLLVRLDPDEREQGDGTMAAKGFVDKNPDNGLCVHFDPDTGLCRIWEKRPRVCREYNCNNDFLLQVVFQQGFTSIAKLVKAASHTYIPKECYISVPYLDED